MFLMVACRKILFLLLFPVFFVGLRAMCPPGWLTWQDSCYILLPKKMNWFGAFRVCDRPGSAMAMPESQQEQDFIWRETNASRIQKGLVDNADMFELWIGCKKNVTNPGQLSCPGKKVDSEYTNWETTKKRDKGENCIRMNSKFNGKWSDNFCSSIKFAACEMRITHHAYCLTADDDGRFTPQCLLNHGIKNLTVNGVVGCGQACWAEPRCHSFNLRQRDELCQLNNSSRLEANVTGFKNMEGCSFFEL